MFTTKQLAQSLMTGDVFKMFGLKCVIMDVDPTNNDYVMITYSTDIRDHSDPYKMALPKDLIVTIILHPVLV